MKKRILSLLICVLLVLPTVLMTGCSKEDHTVTLTGSDATALTITLYTICEEEVDEETRQAVEDELNTYTRRKFNTNLKLRLYTEDEYNTVLAKDLEASKKPVAEKKQTADTTKKPAKQTGKDGKPLPVQIEEYQEKYPAEEGTQVDIFLINNIDLYNECILDETIFTLAAEIIPEGASYELCKYINPVAMKAVTNTSLYRSTYAIPNNKVIDDYEYVLINKAFADANGYDPAKLTELKDLGEYIDAAKASGSFTNVVLDTYGVAPNYEGLSSDSLQGTTVVKDLYTYSQAATADGNLLVNQALPKSILGESDFKNAYKMLHTYRADGTMIEGEYTEDTNAACVFLKGNIAVQQLEKYTSDYYVEIYRKPVANNETIFNSLYAVNAKTKNVTRCMQIIHAMQTDPEFVNMFKYGVEGVHYEKSEKDGEEDLIYILPEADNYKMSFEYAGNQFLAYRNDKMTVEEDLLARDNWALGKQQNNDTAISPYLAFSANTSEFEDPENTKTSDFTTQQMTEETVKASVEALEKLAAFEGTAEEFDAFYKTVADEFEDNEYVDDALENDFLNSPYGLYVGWHKNIYPAPKAEQ